MMTEEIEILLAHRKYPSVSIIIPTDRLDPKRNHEVLKKSVRQGKALLAGKDLPGQITNELVSKLDMCSAHIPEIIPEGLGFYISPSLFSLISFPFEVKRKVTVGYSFELRDLLYLQQYKSPYYVLNLSRNGVQLFKGILNELEEIKYEGFPMLYEDQFKYQPASVAGSSNASFAGNEKEKEKDQITDIRLRTVFRDADAHVRNLLSENTKVLLAGSQRLTSLFVGVTTLGVNLCGRVPGSYDENNIQKLRQNACSLYYRIRKKDIERQIKAVIMNSDLAEGLQKAWTAAAEGKGQMLLVEKDLHHRGYLKEGQNTIQLQPPKKPYTMIPDAVDELIKTVQSKNGKLLFTDNDRLKEFGHLALVLRH